MTAQRSPAIFRSLGDMAAAELLRHPVAAAAVLGASAIAFDDVTWTTGAAFLATRLFARWLSRPAVLDAGAVVVVVTALPAILLAGGVLPVRIAAAAIAVVFGSGRLSGIRCGGAAAILVTLAASFLPDAALETRVAGPLAAATALALVLVGARWPFRILLPLAIGASVWFLRQTAFFTTLATDPNLRAKAVLTLLGAAFAPFAAWICGVVAESVLHPAPEGEDRCAVAVQRAPWRACILVAAIALVSIASGLLEDEVDRIRRFLVAGLPAAVMLAAIGRSAVIPSGILPSLAVATTLGSAAVVLLNGVQGGPAFASDTLAAEVAVLWTFALCFLLGRDPVSRTFDAWVWPALVVVACALALPGLAPALDLAALAFVPFIVQGIAASAAPARTILGGAARFGLVATAVALAEQFSRTDGGPWLFLRRTPAHPQPASSALWPIAMSVAIAVAALAARRLRSMTALPPEHPIWDWDATRRDAESVTGVQISPA